MIIVINDKYEINAKGLKYTLFEVTTIDGVESRKDINEFNSIQDALKHVQRVELNNQLDVVSLDEYIKLLGEAEINASRKLRSEVEKIYAEAVNEKI